MSPVPDPAWMFGPVTIADDTGGLLRKFACVIRWEPNPGSSSGRSKPYIFCNAAHPCVGIAAVRVDYTSGRLVITPTASFTPVIDGDPKPDETFTLYDVTFGASMGNEAGVQMLRGGLPIRADHPDFATGAYALANCWFTAQSWTPPPPPPPPVA